MAADLSIVVKLVDKASGPLGKLKRSAGALGGALRKGALVGGVALVGLGVAALKFGTDFKKAENIIRVGTGTSGEALGALYEDFKATFAEVPADMETVAQATADLNTRLGLTGKPLQDMTKRFLELSRITKTDVTANIESVTRLFGDWSVATEDQAGSLDRLFKTSQATGIGVDKLSQLVVQFGAPLRGFGFTLDQSTAILAKFEKEGVNTEAVMGGLKIGLGKVAAAGKDPAIELAKVSEAIQTAGSVGEANVAAIEMFGSRAGPDMAAAIREGRFEVDDFIAQMDAGGTGILETAKATETWQEKLKILRNKVLVKLEPTLVKLVDKVGELADWLGKKVPGAIDKIEGVIRDARPHVEKFIGIFHSGLKTLREAFEPLVRWILNNKPALIAAITAIGVAIVLAFGPGAVAIAAIVGLILILGLLRENWDEIKAKVTEVVDSIIAKIEGIPVIGEIFKATVRVVVDKVKAVISIMQGLIDFAKELIRFFKAVFSGDWAAAWDSLKEMAKIALNLFLDFLQLTFFGTIKSILASIVPWDWVKDQITGPDGFVEKIKGAFNGVITFFEEIGEDFMLALRTGIDTGREWVKTGLNLVLTVIEKAANFMIGGINKISGFVSTLGGALNAVLGFFGAPKIPSIPEIPRVSIPRLHKGGEVIRSGLAEVREGERYFPRGTAPVQVNFNHYGTLMGNEAEAERFAAMIDTRLRRKWRRAHA